MALTRLDKTGDGTTTVYDVDFDLGFISRGHVYVYLAENSYTEQLSYTWLNNTQIQLATPVTNGIDFAIRRVVPRNNIVNDYESGAILREKELDNSFKQAIMLLQEIGDGYIEVEGTFVIGGDLKAEGEIEDGTGNVLSEKMNKRPDAGQLNIVVFDADGNSEDSGVNITGLTSGEGFAFTESKTLADGQVSVTFNTLDPLFARFVVCGDNVDNGALCAADYQTSAGSKTVTLTSSYPAGTVLMGIQNDQTADIETNIRYFTRPIPLAEAVANTNVQEGDTVIISDRGNGLFEYKTAQTPNTYNIVACDGVPELSLVLDEISKARPTNYGFVGDGSTEDTDVINYVINNAKAKTIDFTGEFVEGTELVYTGSIDIQRPVTINLGGLTHKKDGGDLFKVTTPDMTASYMSVTLMNGTVEAITQYDGVGFVAQNNNPYILLSNVAFIGWYVGYILDGSYCSNVQNCRAVANTYGGLICNESHATIVSGGLHDFNVEVGLAINAQSVGVPINHFIHNIKVLGGGYQKSKYGLFAENAGEVEFNPAYCENNTVADAQLGFADSGAYQRACYNSSVGRFQTSSVCSLANVVFQHAVGCNFQGQFNAPTVDSAANVYADGFCAGITVDVQTIDPPAGFNFIDPTRVLVKRNGRPIYATSQVDGIQFGEIGNILSRLYQGYTVGGREALILESLFQDLIIKAPDVIRFTDESGNELLRVNDTDNSVTVITPSFLLEAIPTSGGGLPVGSVWNDAGTLKIV